MDLSTAAVAAASEVPPDLDGEELAIDGASISMVVCFKSYGSFTVAFSEKSLGFGFCFNNLPAAICSILICLQTPVQIVLETKEKGRVKGVNLW